MKLTNILNESFNVSEDSFEDDVRLVNFEEWDSLSHMYFISKLETTYEINLTGDEIADMYTIGDIRKIIKSKGKEL